MPNSLTSLTPAVASDGTDLAACHDGTCEVRVDGPAKIPLSAQFQVTDLRVESINSQSVTLQAVTALGGPASFGCAGKGCRLSAVESSSTEPTTATARAFVGTVFTANRIRIEVVAISDGSAILRFAPVK